MSAPEQPDGPALHDLRTDYRHGGLDEADAAAEPFEQFRRWFSEAQAQAVPEPNAMVLATAGNDGPDARVVLLKGVDTGFTFYTNYRSEKARQLEVEPRACLLFYWLPLARQVRINGQVERVTVAESEAYFATRPRESQLGAHASPQSQAIPSRASLDAAFAAVEAEYATTQVPRPPHWGGYRLVPERLEFWQGRPSRLHDRLRYRLVDGAWVRERLAP
jgi:pyridoxamine 5'-phosphate oxidase